MKSLETHHRFCDFLNEAMILFDHIIQMFDLEYFNKLSKPASISNKLIFSKPA